MSLRIFGSRVQAQEISKGPESGVKVVKAWCIVPRTFCGLPWGVSTSPVVNDEDNAATRYIPQTVFCLGRCFQFKLRNAMGCEKTRDLCICWKENVTQGRDYKLGFRQHSTIQVRTAKVVAMNGSCKLWWPIGLEHPYRSRDVQEWPALRRRQGDWLQMVRYSCVEVFARLKH